MKEEINASQDVPAISKSQLLFQRFFSPKNVEIAVAAVSTAAVLYVYNKIL